MHNPEQDSQSTSEHNTEQDLQPTTSRNSESNSQQNLIQNSLTTSQNNLQLISQPDYTCSSGTEYELSQKGRYVKRNIRGTINIFTEKLVAVFDNCKISHRKSVHIISATAEAFGIDPSKLILNKNSFRKIRNKIRQCWAEKSKLYFGTSIIPCAVCHWDGKMIEDEIAGKVTDRVPIVISYNGNEKIIDVPSILQGTGKLQAEAIYKALKEWSLTDSIKALCCDTTASNLGPSKGAAVLLEQLLDKDLLYLPCRHHIFELLLADCFINKLSCSSGPEVPLFNRFKNCWENVDRTKYQTGLNDDIPKILLDKVQNILLFIEDYLKKQLPRGDYKELLMLSQIFLGGAGVNVKFYKPGATSHARWMAKAIYSLKIYIFRDQFKLTKREEKGLFSVCQFVVFVYIKYWFPATLAVDAPKNDLQLIKDLLEYRQVDSVLSKSLLKKFKNHLWYLSPEVSALSFFDDRVSDDIKKKMVEATKEADEEESPPKRFFINKIEEFEKFSELDIDYFINSCSLNLFDRFNISKEFLELDVSEWPSNEYYLHGLYTFKKLLVVNDIAERAVHLAEQYLNVITSDEKQKQYLIQIVSEYKKKFSNANKATITRKFKPS